ncbi:MAG: hypothetical protein M0R80_07830 [Proteobacteria bacterium]|jgi:hypothetical protein|nr:hypothetical protein [Pseudomonadota bacterium]
METLKSAWIEMLSAITFFVKSLHRQRGLKKHGFAVRLSFFIPGGFYEDLFSAIGG